VVKDLQVAKLRKEIAAGRSKSAAASAAGIPERTALRWREGPLPSQTKTPRDWRTRTDPLVKYWEKDVVPLLVADREDERRKAEEPFGERPRQLHAKAVLKALQAKYPADEISDGVERTLQRRMREWRALAGPEKEVVFPQEHPYGDAAAFDFTHCTELGVTINGELFEHLFFTYRLLCSRWTSATLAFGETFEAMTTGLQDGFWGSKGVPARLRHDGLSAATHELKRGGGRGLNARFKDFLAYYGNPDSSRITAGRPQENGGAEKGNDLFKTALDQALRLRGSRDFRSQDEYLAFVDGVVARDLNRPSVMAALEAERAHLRPLPARRLPEYTEHEPTVRAWSTVRINGRLYSVPSRLIGHKVKARLYANKVELLFADKLVETFPRLRGEREVRIDYRHVVGSLIRKLGAFEHYRFREELFPSLAFRKTYDRLTVWRGERAEVEYVRILHLAATTMECQVQAALELLLEAGERFDYAAVKELVQPRVPVIPTITIPTPDPASYDRIIEAAR